MGTEVRVLGVTDVSMKELLAVMKPHFKEGSYDVLSKNCNTCSDCALGYLLGRRLDEEFSSLERLAQFAESNFGLAGLLTGYTPNPKAALFVKESTVKHLKSIGFHLQNRVQKKLGLIFHSFGEMSSAVVR